MKRRSGITLIELLAVVTIIAIIASLLIVGMSVARNKARVTKAHAEVSQLIQAWKAYWTVYQRWPSTCTGDKPMNSGTMQILMGENAAENTKGLKFMEPNANVLTTGFLDPWGNLYRVNFSPVTAAGQVDWYETTVLFPNKNRYEYDPQ